MAVRIFLKLHMKLDIDKSSKVTEPNFWKKIWFLGKSGKSAKNFFFLFFQEMSQRIFPKFSKLIQLSVLHNPVKTASLGKIWFSRYFEKGSQPIRLPRFSNFNISRNSWVDTSIFCMVVDLIEKKSLIYFMMSHVCPN